MTTADFVAAIPIAVETSRAHATQHALGEFRTAALLPRVLSATASKPRQRFLYIVDGRSIASTVRQRASTVYVCSCLFV